jgi:hypothetical protein
MYLLLVPELYYQYTCRVGGGGGRVFPSGIREYGLMRLVSHSTNRGVRGGGGYFQLRICHLLKTSGSQGENIEKYGGREAETGYPWTYFKKRIPYQVQVPYSAESLP